MSTVAAAQLSLSLQFPPVAIAIAPSSSARHSRLSPLKPTPLHYPPLLLSPKLLHHSISRTTTTTPRRRSQYGRHITTTAIEEGQEEKLNTSTSSDTERLTEEDSSVLKDEALKAAVTRNDEEQSGGGGELWRGVAEEIREIEWPAFGKVVGTTGVVLGVIAGSSVVLLTVNAVLAELSDRVFAGRGVQDFFG